MANLTRTVRVTVTVDVIRGDGVVENSLTTVREEGCGNPAWTTRVAHRTTEAVSDSQRLMLAGEYGEVDEEWKRA